MIEYEEAEQAALMFATQMMSFDSDKAVVDDEISETAMKLAIDWVKRKEARAKIFTQKCPNWIDLAETDISELNLKPYKPYWFEARPQDDMNAPAVVVYAQFIESDIGELHAASKRENRERAELAVVRGKYGKMYTAQHVILEEGGSIYTEDYKPELPDIVKAQIASTSSKSV